MHLGRHDMNQTYTMKKGQEFIPIKKVDSECTSVVVPYCYLFLLPVFILWFSYYVSDIF